MKEQPEIKKEIKEEVKKEEVKKPEELGKNQEIERNEDGTFKSGVSGNPGGLPGRTPGSKDFRTVLREAFVMIAKSKGKDMDPDSIEVKMVTRAVLEAMSGDFRYFQYLIDRKYGKVKDVLDLMGGLDLKGVDFNLVTNKEDLEKLNKKNENSGDGNENIPPKP